MGSIEVDEFLEGEEALLDLVGGEGDQAVTAKLFDDKRSHDGASDHGASEVDFVDLFDISEITEKAACEGIACACGIADIFEGEGGSGEDHIAIKQHCAIFTAFDDDDLGSAFTQPMDTRQEAALAAEIFEFFFVEEEEIDVFQDFHQSHALARDPEVHGVTSHETGGLDLFQDLELKLGIDVGEQDGFGFSVAFGELGGKVFKDVELCIEGVGLVHVLAIINPRPMKGFACGALKTFEVDTALCEAFKMFLGKVFADDGDHPHRSKERAAHGKEVCAAPEHKLAFPVGGFNGIKGHRAYHQKMRHQVVPFVL